MTVVSLEELSAEGLWRIKKILICAHNLTISALDFKSIIYHLYVISLVLLLLYLLTLDHFIIDCLTIKT